MQTIAIIGGGITGLSAASTLQGLIRDQALNAKVVLIEAQPKLGGKISSIREDGFIMETGADSIVSRKAAAVTPLIEQAGLTDELVYNATGRSFLYIDGRLQAIPEDTLFGIPLSIESLARSELISAEGKVVALRDFYTPNKHFTKDDSVGSFLTEFLGQELVERQIAPVLSGVYSGSLDDLTIASTMPYLLDYKNEYGSIIAGLEANKKKFQSSSGGKFFSFEDGLSQLVEKLATQLTDIDIRTGVAVERISREGSHRDLVGPEDGRDGGTLMAQNEQDGTDQQRHGARYTIELADGSQVEADHVILATLHRHAQEMLGDTELDALFSQLTTSSLISVYLGYDIGDDVLPETGTGFIVANREDLHCDACTWTSRKWTHTSRQRRLLVRLFYKSSNPHYEQIQRMSEQELMQIARQDIAASLGIEDMPVSHTVTRWQDAMPNYSIRHHAIVKQLEATLSNDYPGVYLAGCSYHGVGIPDCIESGEHIARQLVARLG